MKAPILRMGRPTGRFGPIPYVVGYPRARVLTLPAHPDPTTAARTAKHMTAVVFHPRSQPEKETTMAEETLTTRMREAIPDLPPALSADRKSCQSKGHGDRNDWRAVPGWSKYQVSSSGQVRRIGQSKGAVTGRVLRPLLNEQENRISLSLSLRATPHEAHGYSQDRCAGVSWPCTVLRACRCTQRRKSHQ